jgi:hypothetical protein
VTNYKQGSFERELQSCNSLWHIYKIHKHSSPILEYYHAIMNALVTRLQKMHEVSQPLSTCIWQPILRKIGEGIALEAPCEDFDQFFITREWICQFVKQYMNWSFWKWTNVTNKTSIIWCEQGLKMSYWIAYLVNVYNIPSSLVVKNNQKIVHLVLTTNERTLTIKGKKHVKTIRVDNKK